MLRCASRSSCLRDGLLSILCLLTSGCLLFAVYRRCRSRHGRSHREASILLLSVLQTTLSGLYSIMGREDGLLIFTARVIKVLQSLTIGWVFLVAVESLQVVESPHCAHLACSLSTGLVILYYIVNTFVWSPSYDGLLCRDLSWVAVSVLWFVASFFVSLCGIYLLNRLPQTQSRTLTVSHEENAIEFQAHISEGTGTEAPVIGYKAQSTTSPVAPAQDIARSEYIIETTSTENTLNQSALWASPESKPTSLEDRFPVDVPRAFSVNNAAFSKHFRLYKAVAASKRFISEAYRAGVATVLRFRQHKAYLVLPQPARATAPCTTTVRSSELAERGCDDAPPGSALAYDPAVAGGSTHFERKKQHLLILLVVDAIAAAMTMVWDIIVWLAYSPAVTSSNAFMSHQCYAFRHHPSPFETFVYVMTRTVAYLVPHWAVFVVFYWNERALYRPYSERWDISLQGIELRASENITLANDTQA